MADTLNGTNAILTGAPVKASGAVTRANLGSTLPTDGSSPLDAAFKSLGYVSEDGVTRTIDASDDKIKAWGGDVVKVVRSDYSTSYTLTFMESANGTLLKALYGEENVKITSPSEGVDGGKIAITNNSRRAPRASYTFEMLDENTFIREVIPNGQISMNGDVQFVHSAVISYSVTIDALPDAKGNNAYSYLDTVLPDNVTTTKAALTQVPA